MDNDSFDYESGYHKRGRILIAVTLFWILLLGVTLGLYFDLLHKCAGIE